MPAMPFLLKITGITKIQYIIQQNKEYSYGTI
jgi:hypothetical protein